MTEKKDAKDFEFKKGKIRFDNVNFRHAQFEENKDKKASIEKNKMLLKNFSLEIEPGTTNAIVGSSGFGKTTLFNLLYRLYKPEKGSVYIDD